MGSRPKAGTAELSQLKYGTGMDAGWFTTPEVRVLTCREGENIPLPVTDRKETEMDQENAVDRAFNDLIALGENDEIKALSVGLFLHEESIYAILHDLWESGKKGD
jgi:hypothetical protein